MAAPELEPRGLEQTGRRIAEVITQINDLEIEKEGLRAELFDRFKDVIGQEVVFGGYAEFHIEDGEWGSFGRLLPAEKRKVIGVEEGGENERFVIATAEDMTDEGYLVVLETLGITFPAE